MIGPIRPKAAHVDTSNTITAQPRKLEQAICGSKGGTKISAYRLLGIVNSVWAVPTSQWMRMNMDEIGMIHPTIFPEPTHETETLTW